MSGSAKQIPHTTVESTMFHKSNLLTIFHSVTPGRGPVIMRTIFLNLPLHILRGGFIGTSCRSRDRVPLITGFSSIWVWVTQPRHQHGAWGISEFIGQVGRRTVSTAFIKIQGSPFFTHALFSAYPFLLARALAPKRSSSPPTKVF